MFHAAFSVQVLSETLKNPWKYSVSVGGFTLIQLCFILLPGIILAILMNAVSISLEKSARQVFGAKIFLVFFAFPGTVLHESSHALFCLLFAHRINEIKFFDPDPEDGCAGYVKHSYNPASAYQRAGNFFIGLAPVITGTALIFLITWGLLGVDFSGLFSQPVEGMPEFSAHEICVQYIGSFSAGIKRIFEALFSVRNFGNWRFYLFIYLLVTAGTSVRLSMEDIKHSVFGLIFLVLLIFVFNFATFWLGDFTWKLLAASAGIFTGLYSVFAFALILNAAAALIFGILRLTTAGKSA